MKKLNKYLIILFFYTSLWLCGCVGKEEQTIKLICGDEYKLWLVLESIDKTPNRYYFVYFGKDGQYHLYDNKKRQDSLSIAEEFDIVYPNQWELRDDSVIILKRDNHKLFQDKIIYLDKDTFIISFESGIRDTLLAPPESVVPLLRNFTPISRSQ